MNILLIEQECFSRASNKPLHVGAHSLHIAFALSQYKQGTVHVLAQKGSVYEKVALSKGLNIIHMPNGMFASLFLALLIKRNEINLIHTFDVGSARLVNRISFFVPHIRHIHSENRTTEDINLFSSRIFKKTDSFVFADESFKKYYASSLIGKKSLTKALGIPFCKEENDSLENTQENLQKDLSDENNSNNKENLPALNPVQCMQTVHVEQEASFHAKDKIRFLVPAPLALEGGYREILHALQLFEQYEGQDFAWEAYFFGAGEEINDIIEFGKGLDILDHLAIFIAPEHENFFAEGDVCIFPVVTKEYIMTPLLYSWAFNVPVICTRNIPYCKTAVNGNNMLVPELTTPASLAGTLHKLINDKSLRDSLTKNGQRAILNFSANETARNYSSLYNERL